MIVVLIATALAILPGEPPYQVLEKGGETPPEVKLRSAAKPTSRPWRNVFHLSPPSKPKGTFRKWFRSFSPPQSFTEPRQEVSRVVPLSQLPVSNEFLERLKNEPSPSQRTSPSLSTTSSGSDLSEETSSNSDEPPRSTVGGGALRPSSKPTKEGHLPGGSYRLISFSPGKTGSGKPIQVSVDLEALQFITAFPPDYSLETSTALQNRLLSLGHGGSLILEVVDGYVVDEPGPDFVIFENPFIVEGTDGLEVYAETAIVSVAEENRPDSFHHFHCAKDQSPYKGCAGVVPVRYAPGRVLHTVGGDLFDLGEIGVSRVKYIRITDTGDNRSSFLEGTEGFDLDGIGLIHTEREK